MGHRKCDAGRIQASGQGGYWAMVELGLGRQKDKVRGGLRACCSCKKVLNEAPCKHRAGAIAFLHLCQVLDLSGGPGHRANYWRGLGSRHVGGGPVRVTKCQANLEGVSQLPSKSGKLKRGRAKHEEFVSQRCAIHKKHFRLDMGAREGILALRGRHGVSKVGRRAYQGGGFSPTARPGGRCSGSS